MGMAYSFLLSALLVLLDYICVIVWMRRLSSVRLKSSRPLSICSKKKKGRWSKWYENNGAAFADYNSTFCGKRSLFLATVFAVSGDDAAWDCQPDYSVHCNVHLSAGVSHARAIGIMSDRRGCRQVYIFGALLSRQWLSFFWLLESRSLILMTMGYVLLINIGHNSLNAVQPSFSPDCFIRLYATAVHQLALSWGGCGRGFTPFIAKALSAVYDNSWTLVAGYVVLTALASAFAAKIAPETVLPHSP